VLFNNGDYIRINPNELIIVNDFQLTFHKIDMKNKQIMLKNNTNGNHFIFAIDEIKSIRYKEDSQVLLKNIAILGSAIYAWWGFLQSSNDYYSRNDINTKVFIFTTGAAGFGYLFGSLIGYPVQRGYNLFRAKWSDILIINERNWRILN
tara:strand:- start:1767 stop:2213 length:447 start_codon:yes stop_codon:yes gene_type:complete